MKKKLKKKIGKNFEKNLEKKSKQKRDVKVQAEKGYKSPNRIWKVNEWKLKKEKKF